MLSPLSISSKVHALYNASAKFTVTAAMCNKLQLRLISIQPTMYRASIEEKLGLPIKPKRPLTPYIRFLSEVRPSILAKNPKLTAIEIVPIVASMWKTLDTSKKEKFEKAYKEEQVKYLDIISKYEQQLTDDDRNRIKETRLAARERKEHLEYLKKVRALNKPKKPATAFILYVKKQTDRNPKENYIDYIKRLSVRWNKLSDVEKEKFKTSDGDSYKKALLAWEEKMIKLGHLDVVRAESVISKNSPKPRSRKPSSE